MAAIDAILDASVRAVKKSGIVEGAALMGTVTAVASGGTVSVARGDDVYPKVRVLSGYPDPTVGDHVELLRSAGGWVCIGALRTDSGPKILSGTVDMSVTSGSSASRTVTFPRPFSTTPVVVASLASGSGSARWFTAMAINPTATGFTSFIRSTDAAAADTTFSGIPVAWIATTY